MVFGKKRKNPDYAFEKVSETDSEYRKSFNKRVLGVISVAFVLVGILVGAMFLNSTEHSYSTQNPKGDLVVYFPENKSKYEIYPGQEFVFDIAAHYELGGKVLHYGITDHDRGQIGMFFSDNRMCERTAFDTMVLGENVKPGTKFTVTLKYDDTLSIIDFTVIEKPAEEK